MNPKSKDGTARAPLTNKELENLMADDFVRLKLTDEEKTRLKEINEARKQRRAQRSIRLRKEEEPILADLRSIGLNVESVWDIANMRERYTEAIPILLKHLLLPYSDRTREGIAFSLAVTEPAVREAWPALVEEYKKSPMGWGIIAPDDSEKFLLGAKNALAFALSVAVTEKTLPELIALAKDRALGKSRILLLGALKKIRNKNTLAKQAIEELKNDPDLQKEIASWRKSHDNMARRGRQVTTTGQP